MLKYENGPNGDDRVVNVYIIEKHEHIFDDEDFHSFSTTILECENEYGDKRGSMLMSKEELIQYSKEYSRNFVGNKTLDFGISYNPKGGAFVGTFQGEFVNLTRTGGGRSKVWLKKELNEELGADMMDDTSDIRRISDIPITRSFVFVDVSDFSEFTPMEQLLVVSSLANIVKRKDIWEYQESSGIACTPTRRQNCV